MLPKEIVPSRARVRQLPVRDYVGPQEIFGLW